jgi:hypothetical protein
MGIPVTQFAVLAGVVRGGLGFGLQAIFSNFVSGLILLFDRSLKEGDIAELESGVRGEVGDIGIRATRIMTNDNIDILVPNAEFVAGRAAGFLFLVRHLGCGHRCRHPLATNEQVSNLPLRMIGHFSQESDLASSLHCERDAVLEQNAIPRNPWHEFASGDDPCQIQRIGRRN